MGKEVFRVRGETHEIYRRGATWVETKCGIKCHPSRGTDAVGKPVTCDECSE